MDGCLAELVFNICSELLDLELIDEQDVFTSGWWPWFRSLKLDDILDATAKLLAQMTSYTAVIQDVEPGHVSADCFKLVSLSNHDFAAQSDESKPVTVQFAIPKNFLNQWLGDLPSASSRTFYWKYSLGYPLPKLADRDPQIVQRYFMTTDNVLIFFDYVFSHQLRTGLVEGKVSSLTYWPDYRS